MIQISKPNITDKELDYINDALFNADIGVGEYIKRFEDAWANFNNKRFGVACNSGTNAIYLALKSLGIKAGDNVIVPEFTMVAGAWAVSYTGATPIFADCLDDLTLDPVKLQDLEAKAILITPIYGRSVCSKVYEIARDKGWFIVEDMAEAHGIIPKGDISCFSFYGNKILTTGEGGMCLTNDERVANEIRLLANMYFDKGRTMIHPKIGHNFRMTNLQASIGLAQVERVHEILKARKQIETWYNKYIPEKYKMPKRDVVWVYDIQTDKQEELKHFLLEKGVDSRYFFKPMSQQPMYLGEYWELNAYKWSKRGLYLPCHPELTQDEIKYICKCLSQF